MTAISPTDLFNRMKTENFCLIDVREPSEHQEVHIANCVLIPLASFKENPGQVQHEGRAIVFICRSGRRSEDARKIFASVFSDLTAYNLTGGILAWEAAGLPVVKKNELD